MKKIRIITDSASDINTNMSADITVLPITVSFGSTEYRDGVDLNANEFYKKLTESSELPVTSLISPAIFKDAYLKAVENGEQVVVITMSGKLSGTYQSAVLAAEEFENDVFVVDSKNVTIGEQILVKYAERLAENGMSAAEIAKTLETEREKIHILAVLDTLEYLKKGGRISKSVAFVGGALSIKPVVTVKDGEVALIGKARGSKNGNNYLIKEIENTGGIDFLRPIMLGYTGTDDGLLRNYIEDSRKIWEGRTDRLDISQIGSTIGTHIGPGAIAVAFFSD